MSDLDVMSLSAADLRWRVDHPYESAVKILRAAVAQPMAPVGLLTFVEAAKLLEALGEPLVSGGGERVESRPSR